MDIGNDGAHGTGACALAGKLIAILFHSRATPQAGLQQFG
jgi:hypothetical protein